ncbi:MAG: winged helix-turn-helix transcriptional regulator [bacterium]|nr:winged helix-turn-helix transcriptional regulator [bacterium]MCP4404311.1 winged helix-turn-helix transcriptional regulator [bacterium]
MQTENGIAKAQTVDEMLKTFDIKFFKTLSEPVRLQILEFLLLHGSSDIATIAENMPQDRSVISRHLNLMYEAGILSCCKQSRHVFYGINGKNFVAKLEGLTEKIRECMCQCCPDS